MNRVKKEEIRKHKETRQGLTPEQVQVLDAQDIENALIEALARKMHVARFAEEYDYMYDSTSDARETAWSQSDESRIHGQNQRKKTTARR